MNQPLVSIIVTTKNSTATLGACLRSIIEQSYQNIEIIVVDNDSTDDTADIALKYTDKVLNRGPERSAQRNYGVSQSSGKYILILDSDMLLSKYVVEVCVTKMKGDSKLKALVIPETSFGIGFWARCKALERSFYVEVDWMEAPRFFDSNAFNEAGGYDEGYTGMEDFDLPQRIELAFGEGLRSRVDEIIYHNEQRLKFYDSLKKKYYYGQGLTKYRSIEPNKEIFRKQSSIFRRYRLFLSNPRIFFADPIVGIGTLFLRTCEFGALGIGFIVSMLRNASTKPRVP